MPFNGGGQFDPLPSPTYPAVADTVIYASRFNAVINDILTGLGQCITRDGQSPATADLPMGGNGLTNMRAALVAGEPIVFGQTGASLKGLTVTESLTISAPLLTITSSPTLTGVWDFTAGTVRVPTKSAGSSGTDAASLDFVNSAVTAAVVAAPVIAQSMSALAILNFIGA